MPETVFAENAGTYIQAACPQTGPLNSAHNFGQFYVGRICPSAIQVRLN